MKPLPPRLLSLLITFGLAALQLLDAGQPKLTTGKLPVLFEQTGANAFAARGTGFALSLNRSGVAVWMAGNAGHEVALRFVGASQEAVFSGEDAQSAKINDLRGNDPSHWRQGVSTYAKVRATDLYQGIDLLFHGSDRDMEFDYVVAPHADLSQIELAIDGVQSMRLDGQGALLAKVEGAGDFMLKAPELYQDSPSGREPVEGAFKIHPEKGTLSFDAGNYDRSRPLIIDPIIHTAFFGGTAEEQVAKVALDSSGNIYFTGTSASVPSPAPENGYPTANALDSTPNGSTDVVVTKVAADGTTILWSTYFGGSASDSAAGIVVDASGNATIAGETYSADLPTVNAVYSQFDGYQKSLFVTKFAADGQSLVYSTYYCKGSMETGGYGGIAGLPDGTVAVTGSCSFVDISVPVTSIRYKHIGGRSSNAVILKLSPSGAMSYSGFICGILDDYGSAIALDASGKIYVAIRTKSGGAEETPYYLSSGTMPIVFPASGSGPIQMIKVSGWECFVAKLDPATDHILWSTMLGGQGDEWPRAIKVDAVSNVYVTGTVDGGVDANTGVLNTPSFPTTNGAFQTGQPSLELATSGNGYYSYWDAGVSSFLTKIDSTGSAIAYSTMFGGRGAGYIPGSLYGTATAQTYAEDLDVNSAGEVTLTGITSSPQLPQRGGGITPSSPPDEVTLRSGPEACTSTTIGGDAFVARFTSSGRALVFSTFLGTEGPDEGYGVAVAANGDPIILGRSQRAGKSWDAFLTRVHFEDGDLAIAVTDSPDPASPTGSITYTLTVSNLVNATVADASVVATLSNAVDPDLPFTFTVDGVTKSQGSHVVNGTGNIVNFDLGTLPPLGTATLTIHVSLSGSAGSIGVMRCAGVVASSAVNDVNSGNNTSIASTTVNNNPPPQVDLGITKTTESPFVSGHQGSWKLSVTNYGDTAATGVVVTDMLSELSPYASSQPSAGSISTGAGSNIEYVQQLYSDLLGRALDSAGTTAYLTPLNSSSMTRAQVALAILNTTEARERRISGMYYGYFRTSPTRAQITATANNYPASTTPQIIRNQFVSTNGYYGSFGGSSSSYARVLFLDLIGHPIDSTHEATIVAMLGGGGSKTSIVQYVQGLPDYQVRVINVWFTRYLGRPATTDELNTYTLRIVGDQNWEPVLADILASSDYFSHGSRNVVWNIGTLAPGATATATINVALRSFVIGSLSNTASVTFSGTDSSPENDSSTANVDIIAPPATSSESPRVETGFASFQVEGGQTTRLIEGSNDMVTWTVLLRLPAGAPPSTFREYIPAGRTRRFYRIHDL